jgi:hypothetical protein
MVHDLLGQLLVGLTRVTPLLGNAWIEQACFPTVAAPMVSYSSRSQMARAA